MCVCKGVRVCECVEGMRRASVCVCACACASVCELLCEGVYVCVLRVCVFVCVCERVCV